MNDFSINEMQQMQKTLQDWYKDKWEPISPETGKNKLLWMIGEIGEVIDIIKKRDVENAAKGTETRKELVEELADVLMYYNDVMLCYGISAEELRNCSNRKWRTSFRHILPLTALKILDGRQPACGFLPCHQQNMLENPHTIPIGTVS